MKHFLWRVFSSVRVCVVIWWGLQRRGYVVFFFFALFIERNWRELRVCVRSLDGTGAFMEGFCTENLFFFTLIYKRGKSLPKKRRWGWNTSVHLVYLHRANDIAWKIRKFLQILSTWLCYKFQYYLFSPYLDMEEFLLELLEISKRANFSKYFGSFEYHPIRNFDSSLKKFESM